MKKTGRAKAKYEALCRDAKPRLEGGETMKSVSHELGIEYATLYMRAQREGWALPNFVERLFKRVTKYPLPDGQGFLFPMEPTSLNERTKESLEASGFGPLILVSQKEFDARTKEPEKAPSLLNQPEPPEPLNSGPGEPVKGLKVPYSLEAGFQGSGLLGSDANESNGPQKEVKTSVSVPNSHTISTTENQNEFKLRADRVTERLLKSLDSRLPVVKSIADVERVLNMRARMVGLAEENRGFNGPPIQINILANPEKFAKPVSESNQNGEASPSLPPVIEVKTGD